MSDYPAILDLWDFSDIENSETRFREWIDKVPESDPYRLELKTQLARTFSLRHKFDTAHLILDEVEQESEIQPIVHVRYLLERGRTFNSDNKTTYALALFKLAFEIASQKQLDYLAVDAAHMLAIAAPDYQSQIEWHNKSLIHAESSEQPDTKKWFGAIYNNLGWTYHAAGEYEKALDIFQKGLAWRESQGNISSIHIAKYTIARTLRSLKRYTEALTKLQDLRVDIEAAGDKDGFVYEEIGECLLALNRVGESKIYFKQAYLLLKDNSWIEPERLRRIEQLCA